MLAQTNLHVNNFGIKTHVKRMKRNPKQKNVYKQRFK